MNEWSKSIAELLTHPYLLIIEHPQLAVIRWIETKNKFILEASQLKTTNKALFQVFSKRTKLVIKVWLTIFSSTRSLMLSSSPCSKCRSSWALLQMEFKNFTAKQTHLSSQKPFSCNEMQLKLSSRKYWIKYNSNNLLSLSEVDKLVGGSDASFAAWSWDPGWCKSAQVLDWEHCTSSWKER